MIYCSQYNFDKLKALDIERIRTNKKIEYLNIEASLDIETTSYTDRYGNKAAFMYIWMVGIGLDNDIVYGRTWRELIEFLDNVKLELELGNSSRLIVYVHNLGYEFQFMRQYFEWESVFSVAERKPIKAHIEGGIELRDSYILSGYSLENTAKNLTKHKIRKMVGDLDYSLIRTHLTPLSDEELKYCENDVHIVMAYISEEIDNYGNITKIPATNTGRVRRYVKNECYYTSNNHKKSNKGKYSRYRRLMADLTIDKDIYAQLKRAFMGGFTHASNLKSGALIEDVTSVDLSSSYPAVMVSELFPMSRARPLEISSLAELNDLMKKYCLVFDIKFVGLRNILGYESYISESRCVSKQGAVIDNGRIFSAEEITTTITCVDFKIIEKVYSWDAIHIQNLQGFVKGRLPKSIISSIMKLYVDKTELKGVEGKETEYLLSKGMLNSVYGMSVTDVLQDNNEYNEEQGWHKEPIDVEETIDEYNKSRNRFLYYPWGVWVTAYARRNVWSAILSIGEDYVYCDTDSVKMINYAKHKGYIERYNTGIEKKIRRALSELKLNTDDMAPMNKHGIAQPLGAWDHDGTYSHFKTLGAKRYMYKENGKFSLVVAGLSKQNGMNYILKKSGGDTEKTFDFFDDNLFIPSHETGKMTHTYLDELQELYVKDYNGVEALISVESGIHLEPCEFTLSISEQYAKFMRMLAQGYIFSGVKHI